MAIKTGLVLEGGALRTMYSSGVCDGFIRKGITFDYVVGTSAGIAYGVSYLSGQFGRNLEVTEKYIHDPRYMGVSNVLDPRNRSYFGQDFVYATIPNELVPFDYETYRAYPGRRRRWLPMLLPVRRSTFRWIGRIGRMCCSGPPVPCPLCSQSTIIGESNAWTAAAGTAFRGNARWRRAATGWLWC